MKKFLLLILLPTVALAQTNTAQENPIMRLCIESQTRLLLSEGMSLSKDTQIADLNAKIAALTKELADAKAKIPPP